MPELPEVETILRGISPYLIGKKIVGLGSSGKRLRLPLPAQALQDAIINAYFTTSFRRAKYLIFSLSTPHYLIMHLGMTGNLGMYPVKSPHAKHDHFWCTLDDDTQLRLNDARRFGSVQIVAAKNIEELEALAFKNLGVEPLGAAFTADYLIERAKNKSISIKNFLMDGRVVVGIGNIYANESLFKARISPKRAAKDLKPKEWEKLIKDIQATLLWAIDCGGSTISDYKNANGQQGYFQINFKVYGKDGAPCPSCQRTLVEEKIGGRASFFCTSCQK